MVHTCLTHGLCNLTRVLAGPSLVFTRLVPNKKVPTSQALYIVLIYYYLVVQLGETTINGIIATSDESGFIGAEVQGQVRNFRSGAHAADGLRG